MYCYTEDHITHMSIACIGCIEKFFILFDMSVILDLNELNHSQHVDYAFIISLDYEFLRKVKFKSLFS